MKLIHLIILLLTLCSSAFSQEHVLEKNHAEGLEKAKQGDYAGAVASFTKAIEALPLDAYAWYNRGMAKNMLGDYEEAIYDFSTCIGISPTYKKVWLNRGITKMYTGNYDGALADYAQTLHLDRDYAEAYYQRAVVYELKGLFEFACTDYNNALGKGYLNASEKTRNCRDTSYQKLIHQPLLNLTLTSNKKSYGRRLKHPIKVGSTENLTTYLRHLRAPTGAFVPFQILEKGDITKVQITYTNLKKKPKTSLLYFDCKQYGEVKLLKGFTTFKKN